MQGRYKRKLLMKLDKSKSKSFNNILHAVFFLSETWEEMTAAVIQLFSLRWLCKSSANDEVEPESHKISLNINKHT